MTLEITSVKTLNFLETLQALQKIEWDALGITVPDRSHTIKLPNGAYDIYSRLWEVFADHWCGNQQFGNDRFFNFGFGDEDFWDGEKHLDHPINASDDVQKLFEICKHAFDEKNSRITFYICW